MSAFGFVDPIRLVPGRLENSRKYQKTRTLAFYLGICYHSSGQVLLIQGLGPSGFIKEPQSDRGKDGYLKESDVLAEYMPYCKKTLFLPK